MTTSGTTAINVNARPTVSLTAPANAARYASPATITLTVNAADSDGSIAQVDFFNGATLIGSLADAPYLFHWTDVAAGNYTLSAKATDNLGEVATSSPVTIALEAAAAGTGGARTKSPDLLQQKNILAPVALMPRRFLL